MLKKISLKFTQDKFLSWVTKISVIVWLTCILGVFAVIGYVVGIRKELFDKAPDAFMFLLLGLILLGCLAFLVGVVSFTAQLITKRPQKKQNVFIFLIRLFFILAILPLYLLVYIIRPLEIVRRVRHHGFKELQKSLNLKLLLSKAVSLILVGAIVFPIWIGGYSVIAVPFGFMHTSFQIMGNSMSPTFQDKEIMKAFSFSIQRFFKKPKKGDIVVFRSGRTVEKDQVVDYVKRVVGLPGDEIEIKDGYLFINGELANEPYLYKPRSTFGGNFLKECQKIKIPNGYYFVLGDNRKRSKDSREIGLIAHSEIISILPFSKQQEYKGRWDYLANTNNQVGLPTFDPKLYYEKLNNIRKEKKLGSYKPNRKLEEAARLRAETIVRYNVDVDKSKLTPQQAYNRVGYYNIKTGEIVGMGYFDEDELLNYWLEFERTSRYIYDKEFQETGVAAVIGKINNCETQVIVQEFGAYLPPNYSRDIIQSWERTLSKLKEILPSWENIRNYPQTYEANKQDAERIIEIINIRIARIEKIVSNIKANKWLTSEESQWTYEDNSLYEEQEAIAKKLNSQVWK